MMDPYAPHPGYGQPPPPNYAPKYVMLQENTRGGGGLQPPPGRRNLPRYYSRRSSSGGACGCGCLCWCCCFLLLIFVVIAAAVAYTVVTLDPKPPSYKVEHLGVGAFKLQPDFSLHTELVVTVSAGNPNRNIGIRYGEDSAVAVLYKGAMLCSGKLPAFYQGHMNTTSLTVVLRGDSTFGSGLQQALEENRQSSTIPLEIYVKVPVVLKAWNVDTSQVTVLVNCDLVVDSLASNKKVGIKSATYKVNVKF